MNSKIVVDTNILVALLDVKDVHHSKALKLIKKLEDEERDLLLIDCILKEVYTVLARRCLERGYKFSEAASKVKKDLEGFEIIKAYLFVNKIHDDILELMVKTDGRLNYHDALISIVMKEKEIREIATFDRDFKEVKWLKVEDGD